MRRLLGTLGSGRSVTAGPDAISDDWPNVLVATSLMIQSRFGLLATTAPCNHWWLTLMLSPAVTQSVTAGFMLSVMAGFDAISFG
jgi:hypothetical protein